MPVQIGRYPVGFLELLGSKTNGTTPAVLLDGVMPTVDLTEFWAQGASRQTLAATTTITAPGIWGATTSALTVPIGEFWRVHSITLHRGAVLPAGTTYRLSPAYYDPGIGNTTAMTCEQSQVWTAGEQPLMTCNFQLPRILPPGWAIGVWCHAATLGTASAINLSCDYDRLT